MPRVSPLIASFNAGELSPLMEARADFAKYPNGCRTLENFYPLVHGGVMKRPGTRFIGSVKDPGNATRLIPFEFSTEQAYVLEFGNLYMRPWFNDGPLTEAGKAITGITQANPAVVSITAHGYLNGDRVFISGVLGMVQVNNREFIVANKTASAFEIQDATGANVDSTAYGAWSSAGTAARMPEFVTPYTSAQVDGITSAQSADVLFLAHPSHPPQKITRTSNSAWTVTEIPFDWVPFGDENNDENAYIVASATTGLSVTLTSAGGDGSGTTGVFTSDMVGGHIKLREVFASHNILWKPSSTLITDNTQFLNNKLGAFAVGDFCYFDDKVYELVNDNNSASSGLNPPKHETGVAHDGKWQFEFRHWGSGYAKITAFTDEHTVTASVLHEFPRSTAFADKNIVSTTATSPIRVQVTGHLLGTGDKIFIRGTGTGIDNQLYTVTFVDTNNVDLDGTTSVGGSGAVGTTTQMFWSSEAILSLEGRFIGEGQKWSIGAWSTEKGYPCCVTFMEDRLWWGGATSSPQSFRASRVGDFENHRTSDDDTGSLLFALNTDQVNAIQWMKARKNMLIGTTGSEWAISSSKGSRDPITAGDVRAEEHSTEGAKQSVEAVQFNDAIIFGQRAGLKLMELRFDFDTDQFRSNDLTELAEHILLKKLKKVVFAKEPFRHLWCILEDGSLVTLTFNRDQDVTAWHRHLIGGVGVGVESVAAIPRSDSEGDQLWLIAKRTIDGNTVRYVESLQREWRRTDLLPDAVFMDSSLEYDDIPATTITGLWHLNGETLDVLGDGFVQPQATVSLGSITIDTAASKVQLGLHYESKVETMKLEANAGDGTSQGKLSKIDSAVFRLDQAGEGLFFGHDFTNMDPVVLRDPADAMDTPLPLVDGDTERLSFAEGGELRSARIALKHNVPLPCTILGVMPHFRVQER